MSDFGFAGEINRENAVTAAADTMNEATRDILSTTMEMGGKQTIAVNGKLYAIDKAEAGEIYNIKSGENGSIKDKGDADAVINLLGIDPAKIKGGVNGLSSNPATLKITITKTEKKFQITVAYENARNGKLMGIACKIDSDGNCLAFSPLVEFNTKMTDIKPENFTFTDVKSTGLLASWGIDAKDLNPGDLFFIQQKLQTIKDLISTVHTAGKAQGDVMREATQKLAQS